MSNPIPAIYENGILRPLTPLALPEQTQVQVYIQPLPPSAEATAHRRQVRAALAEAGLSLPEATVPVIPPPLSAERREELAHLFAIGRPLSELIIEEREGHE
jgi:predicted DNA-binding antitoxin AbrB/MazE fold protein